MGSIESQWIVTICGSSEVAEEMVIVSLAIAPGGCVELRTAVVLVRAGLSSVDERSRIKTSDCVDEKSKTRSVFIPINDWRQKSLKKVSAAKIDEKTSRNDGKNKS